MNGINVRHIGTILMTCICIFLFSLSQADSADGPLSVYSVNYPLHYFAVRIGGEHINVNLPVPPDVDPAYWTPDVRTIGKYQQADLILLNGAGYAKWTGKVSLPQAKTVDTSRVFKDRYITAKEITTHSHGAEGKHAHEALAFTTWLDLSLAAEQARAIRDALVRKRPRLETIFTTNFKALEDELLALDKRIHQIVSANPATPLVVSHPVYDYWIQRYGIKARSVHWEPDQPPSAQQIQELEQILLDHPARWMVWEAAPVMPARENLQAMHLGSVVFNPCANVPPQGDFMAVMQQNVTQLASAFR